MNENNKRNYTREIARREIMKYPSDHKYMTVKTCEKIRKKLISEFIKDIKSYDKYPPELVEKWEKRLE